MARQVLISMAARCRSLLPAAGDAQAKRTCARGASARTAGGNRPAGLVVAARSAPGPAGPAARRSPITSQTAAQAARQGPEWPCRRADRRRPVAAHPGHPARAEPHDGHAHRRRVPERAGRRLGYRPRGAACGRRWQRRRSAPRDRSPGDRQGPSCDRRRHACRRARRCKRSGRRRSPPPDRSHFAPVARSLARFVALQRATACCEGRAMGRLRHGSAAASAAGASHDP